MSKVVKLNKSETILNLEDFKLDEGAEEMAFTVVRAVEDWLGRMQALNARLGDLCHGEASEKEGSEEIFTEEKFTYAAEITRAVVAVETLGN